MALFCLVLECIHVEVFAAAAIDVNIHIVLRVLLALGEGIQGLHDEVHLVEALLGDRVAAQAQVWDRFLQDTYGGVHEKDIFQNFLVHYLNEEGVFIARLFFHLDHVAVCIVDVLVLKWNIKFAFELRLPPLNRCTLAVHLSFWPFQDVKKRPFFHA